MRAQFLDGGLDALAAFPEIGPQVALFGDAPDHRFQGELFGTQAGAEFAGKQRGRDGRLRKRPRGVGGGERAPLSILVDVDEHAAARALGDGAFERDVFRQFARDQMRDHVAEGAQLLVGVDALDGDVDVQARRA